MEQCRIDKYLWSVRIFKTRSQSTDACKKGLIKINEQEVKPSRNILINDIITINYKIYVKTIRVVSLLDRRVGAKLVNQYMEDLTPQEEYDKPKIIHQLNHEYRQKGLGRPTKKERRLIEKLKKK